MALGKEKRKRTPEHQGVDGREAQAGAGAEAAEVGGGSVGGDSVVVCTSKRSKNSEAAAVACGVGDMGEMGDPRGTTEAKAGEAKMAEAKTEGGGSKSKDKSKNRSKIKDLGMSEYCWMHLRLDGKERLQQTSVSFRGSSNGRRTH